MSRKVDLKLNLSLPAASRKEEEEMDSPARSSAEAPSPSSWMLEEEAEAAATSMVVTGCPRCLMYVMLAVDDLRCPKCGSTVIIDFFRAGGGATSEKKNKIQNKKKLGV